MRPLFVSLCAAVALYAFPVSLETLQCDFNQTITDEQNVSLVYSGNLHAKRPALAHWHYSKPVIKDIFIEDRQVTVVEPELEQAIIKEIGDDIDIIAILTHAKARSDTLYEARYHDRSYLIYLNGTTLERIVYDDDFGHSTVIRFFNVQQNAPIESELLKAHIPKGFDLIR